jgi:hypothetical protein
MRTRRIARFNTLLAFLFVASTARLFSQVGVWVARDGVHSWNSIASSADGTKLAATADYGPGEIFTSTDSGATWVQRDNSKDWSHVASSADGTQLVASADSLLWLSTDSGVTWKSPNGGGPDAGFVALVSATNGVKLAALGGQVYTSSDSGATWTAHNWGGRQNGYSGYALACSGDGAKLVVAAWGEHIYTSTDFGATFTAHGSNGYWNSVASSADGSKLVAVAQPGYIYTSVNGGTNWTQRAFNTNWGEVASSSDGTRLVATADVPSGGPIYISTDSGATWTPSGPSLNWYWVASSSDGMKLVAANGGGQIYTYAAPLANDTCSGAIALTAGQVYSMSTANATSTGDPGSTCQANAGNGVWFTYTPAGSGVVTVSTCGSSFDTVIQVFTGTCGGLVSLTCDDDNGPACSGTRASASFSAAGGTTYYILASGYNSATGTLQIEAQLANDPCAGAIALANNVTYVMSTLDATGTGDPAPTCGQNVSKGVWFSFTPSSAGVVQVYTCGSSFDTVLQAYTGTCGALTPVSGGCNDDSSYCFPDHSTSYISFTGNAGTTYSIFTGGYNGDSGDLYINASVVPVLITSYPSGGTANSGDGFEFDVAATGPSPLSYQWQMNGASLAGQTTNALVLTSLYPGNAGSYTVIVSNANGGSVTSSPAILTVPPALDLALDTTGLTWTTSGGPGNYGWYRQTNSSYDGTDSAICGGYDSTHGGAYMQTTVTGPGTLGFYWMFHVSLFPPFTSDALGFYIDGNYQMSIASPFLSWAPETVYVGTGTHTLTWKYARGTGLVHGGGPGYVDKVTYQAGGTQAAITTQPVPQSAVAGSDVTFSVQAVGTPPISYQWLMNGTPIAGAVSSALVLTNVGPIQASNYSVVVSNAYGSPSTSGNALLTVTTVPLAVALDYAGPAWATYGNGGCYGQIGTTYDGVDAVQSGWITNSQISTLQTTLTGPGNLSFWWKVSSETNYDFLRFSINGVEKTNICGEVDWRQQTFSLSPGRQTVSWSYTKDVSLSRGMDAGWIDQITFDGAPILSIAPTGIQQVQLSWPKSVTGYNLQSSPNLVGGAWLSVTDVPVATDDNWMVTNSALNARWFYRLTNTLASH